MDIAKSITDLSLLSKRDRIEVYEGMDAYVAMVVKRITDGVSPIRQIINGNIVRYFHENTNYLVREIIKQRVEKGLTLKNLILRDDKNLEIEISNPDTLKETRLLPEGFVCDTMVCTFGEYFTFSNMDKDNIFGVVIKDARITATINSMFESVWGVSEPV